MNNILLSNELVISGKEELSLFNEHQEKLNVTIMSGGSLLINDFREIYNQRNHINIVVNKNATLIYNHSFLVKGKYELKIKADFADCSSNIILNIHGVCDGGFASILIDGDIKPSRINNQLLENVRIINLNGGKAVGIPNILAHTSKVIANHNLTIGALRPDEINYLMSKGISYDAAKRLIINGFLVKVISKPEMVTKIKEKLL